MLYEGELDWVQFAAVRQPFHGDDRAVLILHGESQAGIDPLSVDQHGAGAARALVAAPLGSGQPKAIAQQVEQGSADIELQFVRPPVDDEMHSRDSLIATAGFGGMQPRSEHPHGKRRAIDRFLGFLS